VIGFTKCDYPLSWFVKIIRLIAHGHPIVYVAITRLQPPLVKELNLLMVGRQFMKRQ
jgi:hypothetical protein